MHDIKMQQIANCILNILYSWVTKLGDLMALRANQVIVLLVPIGFFVLSQVLAELMFAYQVTFYQQIKCIVNGSTTYPITLVFHFDVERFYIKVPV